MKLFKQKTTDEIMKDVEETISRHKELRFGFTGKAKDFTAENILIKSETIPTAKSR